MGKNTNEINHTNLILNVKYITYYVLFKLSPPKFFPVPFTGNLIMMPKLRRLRWYVNNRIYAQATAQGLVLVQGRDGYLTR